MPAGSLPLGDLRVGTTPAIGAIDACAAPLGPGPPGNPTWIHGDTWNPAEKPVVQGSVAWPQASFSVRVQGAERVIDGNDLPMNQTTGVFPIADSDPASAYDRNPNSISAQSIHLSIPVRPQAAASPTCLSLGVIGILTDGVVLFDALDAVRRDAPAHEVLDRCDGHPAPGGTYHHHGVPRCILAAATGASTLVGYAIDGYGIYVERDAAGHLLTDADLDACHGRTSQVPWDGTQTTMYHYVATAEFPYTLGCYHGTPSGSG